MGTLGRGGRQRATPSDGRRVDRIVSFFQRAVKRRTFRRDTAAETTHAPPPAGLKGTPDSRPTYGCSRRSLSRKGELNWSTVEAASVPTRFRHFPLRPNRGGCIQKARCPGQKGHLAARRCQSIALSGHFRFPRHALFSLLSSTWGRADQQASHDS